MPSLRGMPAQWSEHPWGGAPWTGGRVDRRPEGAAGRPAMNRPGPRFVTRGMRMIATSILAGSLLLTGCGTEHSAVGQNVTARSADSVVPALTAGHTVAPRVEPTGGTPRPTRPEGHTVNPHKVAWLEARPSKNGRSLRIVWWSGVEPCHVLDRVGVKETSKRVTVTLWEGSSSKVQNVACIDIAIKKVTTVKLKAPLGKRKIVDGAKR